MWLRKAKVDYFMYLFLTLKLYPVKDKELFYNKNWGTQFLCLNFGSIVFARAGAQPAGEDGLRHRHTYVVILARADCIFK